VYTPIDCHQITNNFVGMGSPVLVVGEYRHVVVHAVVGLCSFGQMFGWYGLRIQKSPHFNFELWQILLFNFEFWEKILFNFCCQ
jgi:hypothetical protein